jgi:prolyl-tRNA editing enzyme YbaK/EbsC (Cys-tRNA(Pro) deacylase)
VKRVQLALQGAGVETEVQLLGASARTAPEAADALGTELGAIVKSLIFRGAHSGGPLLALVSGDNRADESLLADGFGEPVERADADFVRAVTGFAIGGIPPLAHATPLTPLIDEDLGRFDVVWCAAGTPHAIFPIGFGDLVRVTGGRLTVLRDGP